MLYAILIFVCVMLAAPLEFALTAIINKINSKRKWHPFVEAYNQALENASSNCFSMKMEPNIRASVLFGIIGFSFLFFVGVISLFLGCVFNKITILDFALASCLFALICLPFISIFLHFFTKQVHLNNETIFIKTFFIKKIIKANDVVEVIEDKFDKSKIFRISTADILIIKTNKQKYKVTTNYSNYELAKTKFSELQLLKYSF